MILNRLDFFLKYINVDNIKQILLQYTLMRIKVDMKISITLDDCSIVAAIRDSTLGQQRLILDVIVANGSMLRVYFYADGTAGFSPAQVERVRSIRNNVYTYHTLITHDVYLYKEDLRNIIHEVFKYLSGLATSPDPAYPAYTCYYVDANRMPSATVTDMLVCLLEEEDMSQAFFTWFSQAIGDLDNDGQVTTEDVRLWLRGEQGPAGSDGQDGPGMQESILEVHIVDEEYSLVGAASGVMLTWDTPTRAINPAHYVWATNTHFTPVLSVFKIELSVALTGLEDGTYFSIALMSGNDAVVADTVTWDTTHPLYDVSLYISRTVASDDTANVITHARIYTDATVTNVIFNKDLTYLRAIRLAGA